jgi:hypothetical protein
VSIYLSIHLTFRPFVYLSFSASISFSCYSYIYECVYVRVCVRLCSCVGVCVLACLCVCGRVRARVWAHISVRDEVKNTYRRRRRCAVVSQAFNYASAFNANIGAWNTASVMTLYQVCAVPAVARNAAWAGGF